MPEKTQDKRRHLVLTNTSQTKGFRAPSNGGGGATPVPQPNRNQHGAALIGQLQALKPIAQEMANSQREHHLESGLGLQIQFVGMEDVALAFESLGSELGRDPKKQIEVLSVTSEDGVMYANVFVPDGKLSHFEKYVEDYLVERRNVNGVLNDHHALLNTISSIRSAELRALWTDDPALFPLEGDQPFWWEVWLPVRGNREAVITDFRRLAEIANCQVSEHQINFPERTVVLMFGSRAQLSTSVMMLNCVAELRRAKETAEFFMGMVPLEQNQWVADALARLTVPPDEDAVPRVCLLDSGVNRGHPLLSPFLSPADLHTVHPAWGVGDEANHGSGLAGLVALGDLSNALAASEPIIVAHRLESVKLTPVQGTNNGDSQFHAYLFSEAVARPEISAPKRSRIFTSAITSDDDRDRGKPSAWSSTVDRLAADYEGSGEFPRLFILCAGNTEDAQSWNAYPASLSSQSIRDPGQAWNAITVGAFTEKVVITEDDAKDYTPVAPVGGLSPYTRTSANWSTAWPLKPEVVFEGGNAGRNALGALGISSLHLLTTHNLPNERSFATTNATSAASALCARMAGQLMAAYPNLRPETIRALIVHSAEWTEAMRSAFLPSSRSATKADYVGLIRHCGWGAPNLDRALWSAGNSLTLLVEDVLHPYQKVKGKGVVSRDMNLHSLPWPKEELLALPPNTPVELRITLSYFIEPNPSARGTTSKFHYPSHRLRFDVQRPLDATTEDFIARINAAIEREDDADPVDPKDPNWVLGDRQRHRGSLHQDIWRGTAAELANRGFVAVYPAKGWWRSRQAQERYDLPARYSLLISIHTPQTGVDLYTPIAQQVASQIAVPIEIAN
jgi:hypothetical protein